MIPTFLGITVISFCIIRFAPGDPVAAKFGGGADGPSAEAGEGTGGDQERMILKTKVKLGLLQESGMIRVWDAGKGATERTFRGHDKAVTALRVSPDGRWFASGAFADPNDAGDGLEDSPCRLWSLDGREVAQIEGHSLGLSALAFSRDGNRLATASLDRTCRVWQIDPSGKADEIAVLSGHTLSVTCVDFSPDGKLVASGSRDNSVRLWDAETGDQVAELKHHYLEVKSVAFTSDGTRLLSCGRDRSIVIWDVAKQEKLAELKGASAEVLCLALDGTDSRVAAGLGSNAIKIWNLETKQIELELAGHTGAVESVQFHPQANRLASSSRDKTVRLWDLDQPDSAPLVLEGHTSVVHAVQFTPDGKNLVSGALDITDVNIMAAYLDWLWRLCKLDFGTSFKDGRPVREKILEAFPITLKLNLIAIVVTYLLSIPIGAYAGARRGGLFDGASSLVLFLLYSMPSFWVATMLIIGLGSPRGFSAEYLNFTLPFVGLHGENSQDLPYLKYQWDHFLHLILPVLAMTYGSFAFLSRLARNNMLETLGQDYVRTARAKGLPERKVIGVHALRNSLISIVTIVGNLLPALIGGSVIIESIYSIPGMGMLSFQAILQRDYPVIMAFVTLAAVLTMLGILLSDILYCIVDPRIQLQ